MLENKMPVELREKLKCLPRWLQNELPEYVPPSIISYVEKINRFKIVRPTGVEKFYSTIDEAYERVQDNCIFDDSLKKVFDYENDVLPHSLSYPANDSDGCFRLLFESSHAFYIDSLYDDFQEFLETAKKYRANPQDFWTSHDFVAQHPAFWIKTSTCHDFFWETCYGFDQADFYPCRPHKDVSEEGLYDSAKEKGLYWLIETGGHNESENFMSRYFDPRLTSRGVSLEEATVRLAEKVDNIFDDYGNEKVLE